MPERELPDDVRARLSAELTSGAPLRAPLASQARYATAAPAAVPQRHLRARMLTLAAASLVVLLAAAFAGPPQPRAWLVRTVGNIAGDLGGPPSSSSPAAGDRSPAQASPRGAANGSSPSPEASRTPDADDTPGAQQSPEPRESPEPSQSPEPAQSPEPTQSPDGGGTSGGDGDHSSPNPSPSPDGGSSGDSN